jgi:hypothetical protein
MDAGRAGDMPRFIYMVRDTVKDTPAEEPERQVRPERIVFSPNRSSKWRSQRAMLGAPPEAVLIFDQHNDFPLIRSRGNIHLDRRRPGMAQVERDGLGLRLAFLRRWAATAVRSAWYAMRVRPYVRKGKYG